MIFSSDNLGKLFILVGAIGAILAFLFAPCAQSVTVGWLKGIQEIKLLGHFAESILGSSPTGLKLNLWGIPFLAVVSVALVFASLNEAWRSWLALGQIGSAVLALGYLAYSAPHIQGLGIRAGGFIQSLLGGELAWGFWATVVAFLLIGMGGVLELIASRGE
ncbi:MAG: hypothetical protein H8E40_10055 [Chloroflexi bacterium]|nr:hypothetical protein [Chloroflexota bacterium]